MSAHPTQSHPFSAETLTATHHAMLFAYLAREAVARAGKAEGERIVRLAVRRYGEERGRRMALRAVADGLPLTMTTYLAYGEWRASADSMSREVLSTAPDAHTLVYLCPWHEAWIGADLVTYGRLYCLEIDEALVRGFNPSLVIDVKGSRPNGADCCDFVYHDGDLDDLPPSPGACAVMPWSYHCGHLLSTVSRVLLAELGAPGQDALDAAMDAFRARYGDELAGIIEHESERNFTVLPH